jgi:hypothetical protein
MPSVTYHHRNNLESTQQWNEMVQQNKRQNTKEMHKTLCITQHRGEHLISVVSFDLNERRNNDQWFWPQMRGFRLQLRFTQWTTKDILKWENKRKLQMRLMRSVSKAGRKKGIFKEWEETAFRQWLPTDCLTTIEMKMERPVQSRNRQQQRH